MSPQGKYKKKRSRGSRILLGILLIGAAILLFVAFEVFGPNTASFTQGSYLYIRTGSSYENVKETLLQDGFIRNTRSFDLLAKQLHYPEHVHPG